MNIKKILLSISILCLGSLTAMAQSEQDRFSLGPRFGINFSNVTNVDDSETATGIAVGLTSTYSLSESSGLTVDLMYSEEGYEGPISSEVDLRYFQIPIYFDFFFGQLGERFRPKVYVGIVPGFFLGGAIDDVKIDNKDYYNSFVVAASGGLGFNYRVGSRIWLNTDLRSYIGLSDLRSSDFSEGDAVKSRNVQLSLGLAYGLARYN